MHLYYPIFQQHSPLFSCAEYRHNLIFLAKKKRKGKSDKSFCRLLSPASLVLNSHLLLPLSGGPSFNYGISNSIFSILCFGSQKTLCIILHNHRSFTSRTCYLQIYFSGNIIKQSLITFPTSDDNSILYAIHPVTPLSHKTFCLGKEREITFSSFCRKFRCINKCSGIC